MNTAWFDVFQRKPHSVVLAIVFVGVGLSSASFLGLRRWERTRMQAELNRRSTLISIALQRSLDSHFNLLNLISSFDQRSPRFTQDDFQLFFTTELKKYPEVLTFGWAPKIQATQRQKFETSELRASISERDSTGTVVSAKNRSTYFPIQYFEATSLHTPLAVGIDLASFPLLKNAILKSGDNNYLITAPSPKNTASNHNDHRNLLILIPTYLSQGGHATLAERRIALKGFFVGELSTFDLIRAPLDDLNTEGIDVYIKDEKLLDQLIHIHKRRDGQYVDEFHQGIESALKETSIHVKTEVTVSNHEWSVFFIPNTVFFMSQRTWAPTIILFSGLGITLLLSLYVHQQLEQNQKHKALAQQLADRHQALEQAMVALRETQAQAIQNEKLSSLGRMMAGIAHEINNPVAFIYGNLDHVKDYSDELIKIICHYKANDKRYRQTLEIDADEIDFIIQDLPKAIDSMAMGAKRITEIILALRNFSRLDEAEKKTIDIQSGLDSTLMILNHRLKEIPARPAIKVVKDYQQIPAIECYPGQLNQVFMNLMSNAIDALQDAWEHEKWLGSLSETSCPTLTIRTNQCSDDQVIHICIMDNGLGIPETICSQIFDPFFTTKQVGKGTGLGLSISRQIIVEKHLGSITVDSSIGNYTIFEIQLPIRLPNKKKR